ncbi:YafY family protein [Nocardioides sp. CFH 31398]|uniref:helix-turn-helix transcriptional regulator n=1 Tax=Nocardioides sp. CFH 31398 TaxID=2919579 RepID=UPI001F060A30|nr:WYL domain-containing protein [Nocardioides sp. CFH 31398]MCH1865592.1 WYL domain-containing protein [Nocardioides sp. CFH 31398]
MAVTSTRLLTLLSLLSARTRWPGAELAARLEVGPRTLRRDVQALRDLGYEVVALKGPDGGYRLGAGGSLPPLLLDEDQAVAVALALRTSPTALSGTEDVAARALTGLLRVMPAHLRAAVEDLDITPVANPWAFLAPPGDSVVLRRVGAAVRRRRALRVEVLAADGRRPAPTDDDFVAPREVWPHHLVTWAGRWYLVAHDPADRTWPVLRLDRLHVLAGEGPVFERLGLPGRDAAAHVSGAVSRGDEPVGWPCVGEVLLDLPARTVAPWLPGGASVEPAGRRRSRVRLGAWSWAGVAGLLATFDADLEVVGPPELGEAVVRLGRRAERAVSGS